LLDPFDPLLLLNLLLQCFLHSILLHFSLCFEHDLLVATLCQDVALALELEVDSILEDLTARFDVGKVLLGARGVEFL
jgi:hypothetical protein